jgi:hypothetical protein
MEIDALKKIIFNKFEEQEKEIMMAISMLNEIRDVVKKIEKAWEIFSEPTVARSGL